MSGNRRPRRVPQPRVGASPVNSDRRLIPMDDRILTQMSVIEQHDVDDSQDQRALTYILNSLIAKLPRLQQEVLLVYLFQIRGGELAVKQGQDAGLRATARAVGVNPDSGKQIDKTTVKRNLERALLSLRTMMDDLPDWQRSVIARSLTPGALPITELSLPDDFLPTVPEWFPDV